MRLKSLTTPLFAQWLAPANNNGSIKSLHYWPIVSPSVTNGFPLERVSDSENVSMPCHYVVGVHVSTHFISITTQQTHCTIMTSLLRQNDVILTSKGHRFDVITTLLLRHVFSGYEHSIMFECPSQRPLTRSFDVFFDLRLNIRLSKQLWSWWFETPSRSLWRHCNGRRWATSATCVRQCKSTISVGSLPSVSKSYSGWGERGGHKSSLGLFHVSIAWRHHVLKMCVKRKPVSTLFEKKVFYTTYRFY